MSPRRYVETAEFGKMVKRMVAAYVRRVSSDAGDVESLAGLVELQATVKAAINDAGGRLHAAGYSFTEIAAALGISRQAARERFGEK